MTLRIDAARVLVDAQTEVAPGTVVCDGDRIAWVGATADAPDADERIELPEAVLMPGLVNAHVHTDLSHLQGAVPFEGDFSAWLRGVTAGRAQGGGAGAALLRQALARGTTSFGDIVPPASFDESTAAFEESGARGRLFIEAIGFQPERADEVYERVWELMEMRAVPDRVVTGVSPHAPYSVSRPLLGRLVAVAEGHQRPLAIHVAETLEELAFLRHGIGPLRDMLREFGVDDPNFEPERSLTAFLEQLTLLNAPLLLIHANYMRPSDVPPRATVVYCPTAHHFFNHPQHPALEFMQEGVRVALGSDSAASGDTIDLLSETQFLSRARMDLEPKAVFRMATEWGARALDLDVGALHVGKLADLAAFTPDARYGTLGRSDAECVLTVVGGTVLHRSK
ncbi:MAG: amidohydrolase family protein [Planctomycetota bacterium]